MLPPGKPNHGCADIEWNWLGTDDQGRDVVARLIYGFRISILFGLALASVSSVVGVAAGAVQGYFGGWIDLIFQRLIEIWSSLPQLYLLIIISSIITPSFFVLLGILAALLLGQSRACRARRISARAQFRICDGGAGARPFAMRGSWSSIVLPNAMVATLTFLPFVLNGSIYDADGARFPRLRPAARFGFARRAAAAGQVQPSGALARAHRLLRHRRSCFRFSSSSARRCATRSIRERRSHDPGYVAPLLDVRDLSVDLPPGRQRNSAPSMASRSTSRRGARSRSSANRARANRSRRSRSSASCRKASQSAAKCCFKGEDILQFRPPQLRAIRGNANHHGLSGADDLAQSRCIRSSGRSARSSNCMARAKVQRCETGSSICSPRSAFPIRRIVFPPIRISSRAASVSA